jgi:hypothetical protein
MSDLLSKIKLGSDNIKLVDWPGSKTKVALKILSQKEHQEATFMTERHFKSEKIEVNLVTAEEYESERATQLLYRSLRDPENMQEPVCPTITEFRDRLTREEKKALTDEYLGFESECSPAADNLSSDEFDAVLSALKKNATQTIGNITSTSMLKKLLLIMAKQLQT